MSRNEKKETIKVEELALFANLLHLISHVSIPRAPSHKRDAIIFYSNCNDPKAFGDFSQCGALAYEIAKYSDIPVVLTSTSSDIHRFRTLYGNSKGTYQLYGKSVEIISTAEFDRNAFVVHGYVEVAWCKPNTPTKVREITDTGTKCAFVGTANYQAPFLNPFFYYSDLLLRKQASVFLAGLDNTRNGITFSSFDSFKKDVNGDDLKMTTFPEKLISEARDYGLIYFKKDPNDQSFLTSYVKLFTRLKPNALIIAIGDEQSVNAAVEVYYRCHSTSRNKVILVNYDTKTSSIYYDRNARPKRLSGCFEVLAEQNGITAIITCRSVSNLQMRRLIAGAHQFVAMTGVSSTVEAWGEGKLVFSQALRNNDAFIKSYLSNSHLRASSEMVTDFSKGLLRGPSTRSELDVLANFLQNPSLCSEVGTLNARIVSESSERLSTQLLTWLGIPDRRRYTESAEFSAAEPVPVTTSSDIFIPTNTNDKI